MKGMLAFPLYIAIRLCSNSFRGIRLEHARMFSEDYDCEVMPREMGGSSLEREEVLQFVVKALAKNPAVLPKRVGELEIKYGSAAVERVPV